MRTTDVAVTGLGLVTPGGLGVEAGRDRVTAGSPTAALAPELAGSPVRIACDAERDGLVVGEGAGVLVLERTADARARRARVRARVVGYGTSTDARHITSPHPEGKVAEAAVREARRDAGATARDVTHVTAHGTGTGTPHNDVSEAAMLERVLPHSPHVASTKAVTGHLLGAAGSVEAVFTVLSVERGLVPPTANLETPDPRIDLDVRPKPVSTPVALAPSNSSAFGGHHSVVAVAPA